MELHHIHWDLVFVTSLSTNAFRRWQQSVAGLQSDPHSHLRIWGACLVESLLGRRDRSPATAQVNEHVCSPNAGGGMSTEHAGLSGKERPANCILQEPAGDIGIHCSQDVVHQIHSCILQRGQTP